MEQTYTIEWTEPGARVINRANIDAPDENLAWQLALRVSKCALDLVMKVSRDAEREEIGKLEAVIRIALWKAGNSVTTYSDGVGLIVETESGDEFEISVVRIGD